MEAALERHPDVVEAAVIGVASDLRGGGEAFVVPAAGVELDLPP